MLNTVTLYLQGNRYPLLTCRYTFECDVDSKGRPTSGIRGGYITATLESTPDTSLLELLIGNKDATSV